MKKTTLVLTMALLATSPAPAADAHPKANVFALAEGLVDANGVLIYWKAIGSGAPLFILHGGPGASHDYLLPHLLALAPSTGRSRT